LPQIYMNGAIFDDDSSNIAANRVDCCHAIPKFPH
jgi:hypothetical protein